MTTPGSTQGSQVPDDLQPEKGALLLQDGGSFSGTTTVSRPILGNQMSSQNYTSYPAGLDCGPYACCFFGSVSIGDYMWLIPYQANMLVRVHRATGNMTGFDEWPVEVKSQTSKFLSGAFDEKRNLLWLAPYSAAELVKVNLGSGAMDICPAWPSGYLPGCMAFRGSFIDRSQSHLWLAPFTANMIVRVSLDSCAKVGFNSWPVGFNISASSCGGLYNFFGAVRDSGSDVAWFTPMASSHVVKLDLINGTMTGFNEWPKDFSSTTKKFAGGAFDNQSIWLPPLQANMIVRMNKNTGTMSGFNDWPPGWNPGKTCFAAAIFDGKYVWFSPNYASHLVRVDTKSGSLQGFRVPFTIRGYAVVLDPQTGSLWFPRPSQDAPLVRLSFHDATGTQSATPSSRNSPTVSLERSPTRSSASPRSVTTTLQPQSVRPSTATPPMAEHPITAPPIPAVPSPTGTPVFTSPGPSFPVAATTMTPGTETQRPRTFAPTQPPPQPQLASESGLRSGAGAGTGTGGHDTKDEAAKGAAESHWRNSSLGAVATAVFVMLLALVLLVCRLRRGSPKSPTRNPLPQRPPKEGPVFTEI